jgi:CHAT domain-containing protein
VLCVAALVGLPGCVGDATGPLTRLAPALPRDVARELVSADSTRFAHFAFERGSAGMRDVYGVLMDAVLGTDVEESTRRFALLHPHLDRVTGELARTYRYERPRRLIARLDSLSPRERHTSFELRARGAALMRDNARTPAHREAVAESIATVAATLGDDAAYASLAGGIAALEGAFRNTSRQRYWLLRSVEGTRRHEIWPTLCQSLGVLGVIHEGGGQLDSMALCWNEALEVAQRIRDAEQSARIASFYADHYARAGRLELAQWWMDESLRLVREFRGGPIEVRFLLRSAQFQAERECWNLVARDLDRAELLFATMRRDGRPHLILEFDARLLRARWLVATGRREEASRHFASLEGALDSIKPFYERAGRLYLRWAEGSIGAGRGAAVRAIVRRGTHYASTYSVGDLAPQLALVLARQALAEGNPAQCTRELENFARLAAVTPVSRNTWVLHDALRVRSEHHAGHDAAARAALDDAMRRLAGYVRETDATATGYLFLESCRELRHAGHELFATRAVASLDFDTRWRRLAEQLGTGDRPTPAATRSGTQGAAAGVIHLRYMIGSPDVVRWTTLGSSTRVERLGVSATWAATRVSELNALLAADHRDRTDELHRRLRELAVALLPDEVRDSPGPKAVAIAADGVLEQLPFAALNLSPDAYEPLIARFDVAFDRALDRPTPRASGEIALVVSDPRAPDALRRRARIPPLPHAREEAAQWARLHPRALVLEDTAATKPRVLASWRRAGSLYFAAHVVRDGEAPYVQFLPLAVSGDPVPSAAVLDVADIRAARFPACELVVLSGCESGAAWTGGPVQGASLGDAFLDAGAAATVQTLWPVRDVGSHHIMRRFIDGWRPGDPAGSLAAVQRAFAADPAAAAALGERPFEWAAYAVKSRNAADAFGTAATVHAAR